jgi:hypothetical protein
MLWGGKVVYVGLLGDAVCDCSELAYMFCTVAQYVASWKYVHHCVVVVVVVVGGGGVDDLLSHLLIQNVSTSSWNLSL